MLASPKRVLVIDDSAHVRSAICARIRRMGHEAIEAADGRTGVELARSMRPDAALVDIWMPSMDGYQVAQHLRAELGAAARLVAMTAFAASDARQKCLDAGFDNCLFKPLDGAFLESWLGVVN